MILPITQYGNPVLRVRCKRVKEVTDEIRTLAESMIETMIDANGVGLAAPQVAIELRIAVVDVSHDPECISYLRVNGEDTDLAEIMPLVFINPDLEAHGEKELREEGCLSIEDITANVKRATEVKGTFELLDGRVLEIETDGLLARAIQHEVDHLNGILFVDRLSAAAKLSVRGKLKRLGQ
ncbi:MAG: peptide deformylase [Akkermansiaceae bacterium]|jgi:peptide deformylase|nr:peptide deformylase [Akkermansiaceae bacterium]